MYLRNLLVYVSVDRSLSRFVEFCNTVLKLPLEFGAEYLFRYQIAARRGEGQTHCLLLHLSKLIPYPLPLGEVKLHIFYLLLRHVCSH